LAACGAAAVDVDEARFARVDGVRCLGVDPVGLVAVDAVELVGVGGWDGLVGGCGGLVGDWGGLVGVVDWVELVDWDAEALGWGDGAALALALWRL
jgi:sugar phosphate permease